MTRTLGCWQHLPAGPQEPLPLPRPTLSAAPSTGHRAWGSRKEAAPSPNSRMFQAAGQGTRVGSFTAWLRHSHWLCPLPTPPVPGAPLSGWQELGLSLRPLPRPSCRGQSPPQNCVYKTHVCKLNLTLKKKARRKAIKVALIMYLYFPTTPAQISRRLWNQITWVQILVLPRTCCVTSGGCLPLSVSEILRLYKSAKGPTS